MHPLLPRSNELHEHLMDWINFQIEFDHVDKIGTIRNLCFTFLCHVSTQS